MTETFPSIKPHMDSDPETDHRIRVSQFGDGYSQRVGDGLNTKKTIFSNIFIVDTADKDVIVTFLDAREGWDPFFWTAPTEGTQKKWIAPKYRGPKPLGGGMWRIDVTFEQVFDL